MSDDVYNIQVEVQEGELSFAQIATKYGVSIADVNLIAQELAEQVEFDEHVCASRDSYIFDNDYFDDFEY